MRRARVLVAILFSFFACQTASATTLWSSETIVQKLQVSGNGDFILYLPAGTGSGCQEGGTRFNFTNGTSYQTENGIKAHLAVLMMAAAMGKGVTVAYDSVGGVCTGITVVVAL